MKPLQDFDIHVSATAGAVRRVTALLLAGTGLLLMLHIAALLAPRDMPLLTLRHLLDDFHLDREGNVPTWFASVLLLSAAALMLGLGVRARSRHEPRARRWTLMGFIFVLLSLDEAASLHELTINPLRTHFNLSGLFYWAWVLPALILLAVLAVVYLPFLLSLPRRTALGLVLAATVYVSGTIGMEMFSGTIASDAGGTRTTAYAISVTIEETLELLGLVVLLHTLMGYALVVAPAPAPTRRAVPTSQAMSETDRSLTEMPRPEPAAP